MFCMVTGDFDSKVEMYFVLGFKISYDEWVDNWIP